MGDTGHKSLISTLTCRLDCGDEADTALAETRSESIISLASWCDREVGYTTTAYRSQFSSIIVQ